MLRVLPLLLIASIAVWMTSCDRQKHDISSIKVGMTYDDVESILGKPTAIERGARTLSNRDTSGESLRGLPPGDLMDFDIKKTFPNDSATQLYSRPRAETFGELIYVSWVYSNHWHPNTTTS